MTRSPILDGKRTHDLVLEGQHRKEITVTHRGSHEERPKLESRLERLVREGKIRPPRREDVLDFDRLRRPADPDGRARALLLEERDPGS